ncbi:ATP-binding protein [Marinicellulosiphila megalodicopiae]|uniref:ATP-binding protein n=1 Tax=Marinicellulosiphila megalodicopiae TaxID=2724896 RepID=UPI003BB203A7
MIKQVMINLLVNAVKYSPKDNEIRISASVKKQKCCVIVKNNVNLESNPINISLPSVYDSVGFGLEIVQTILHAHDSELKTEKSKMDFTAKFELPLSQ